jgi:hypothetical protein
MLPGTNAPTASLQLAKRLKHTPKMKSTSGTKAGKARMVDH